MEKPTVPGPFRRRDPVRRQLSRAVMAEGKVLKSNGLLGGAPYSISLSARQVRIEVVTPGHRRYRRPALVRLRYDPPLLVFRAHPPPASSGGVWSRN